MKTLADEIITGQYQKVSSDDLTNDNKLQKKNRLNIEKSKPKSAGNKSFRNHNNLKFIKTKERSNIGKENKL